MMGLMLTLSVKPVIFANISKSQRGIRGNRRRLGSSRRDTIDYNDKQFVESAIDATESSLPARNFVPIQWR